MSASKALYITPGAGVAPARGRLRALFASLLLLVMMTLTGGSLLGSSSPSPSVASAGGMFPILCSGPEYLGSNMSKTDWRSSFRYYPQEDAAGRLLTINEAYGSGIRWPAYQGEGGKDTDFVQDVGVERGAMYEKFKSKVDDKTLTDARSVDNCGFGSFLSTGGSMGLALANGITTFGQMASVVVFDSSFICNDPNKPNGHCFNLVKVIGGSSGAQGSQEGIIGLLTTSVYMPLLVIVAAAAAFWILWHGLVKWKVRDAVFGLVWVLVSVILGIGFLQYPLLLAKAPMIASNTLAGCVIGAFNGMDCTDGSSGGAQSELVKTDGQKANVCKSTAAFGGADATEKSMSMAVNSITCSIWKAFVLEPYSQGSFGRSYQALDVTDPTTAAIIQKAGLSPQDFCVNLYSTKPLSASKDYLILDGTQNQVCNVAAYQLSLGVNAMNEANVSAPHPTDKAAKPYDSNWYKLVLYSAHDASAWSNWSTTTTRGLSRMTIGGIAVLTAVLGVILIVIVSFYALIYYLTSTILLAFLPVFLLFGVHPGRGRKMLLGYAEQILSNIMKYLASAIFLVVAIAFYGGILGAMTGLGTTLLFVAIISAALFMNRQQIIDLIGKVNMGGEQLAQRAFSQTAAGRVAKRVTTKGEKVTRSAMGGGLGAVLASRGNDQSAFQNFRHGAGQGAMREAKRGNTLVAGALREADKVMGDNRRDVAAKGDAALTNAKQAKEVFDRNDKIVSGVKSEVVEAQARTTESQKEFTEVAETYDTVQAVKQEVAQTVLVNGDPDFARMEAIVASLQNLKLQHAIAVASGDTEKAAALATTIAAGEREYTDLRSNYSDREYYELRNNYDALVAEELRANHDMDYDAEAYRNSDLLSSAYLRYNDDRMALNEVTSTFNEVLATRNQKLEEYAAQHTLGENLKRTHTDFKDGEFVTRKKFNELYQKAGSDVEGRDAVMADYNADGRGKGLDTPTFAAVPTLPQRLTDPGAHPFAASHEGAASQGPLAPPSAAAASDTVEFGAPGAGATAAGAAAVSSVPQDNTARDTFRTPQQAGTPDTLSQAPTQDIPRVAEGNAPPAPSVPQQGQADAFRAPAPTPQEGAPAVPQERLTDAPRATPSVPQETTFSAPAQAQTPTPAPAQDPAVEASRSEAPAQPVVAPAPMSPAQDRSASTPQVAPEQPSAAPRNEPQAVPSVRQDTPPQAAQAVPEVVPAAATATPPPTAPQRQEASAPTQDAPRQEAARNDFQPAPAVSDSAPAPVPVQDAPRPAPSAPQAQPQRQEPPAPQAQQPAVAQAAPTPAPAPQQEPPRQEPMRQQASAPQAPQQQAPVRQDLPQRQEATPQPQAAPAPQRQEAPRQEPVRQEPVRQDPPRQETPRPAPAAPQRQEPQAQPQRQETPRPAPAAPVSDPTPPRQAQPTPQATPAPTREATRPTPAPQRQEPQQTAPQSSRATPQSPTATPAPTQTPSTTARPAQTAAPTVSRGEEQAPRRTPPARSTARPTSGLPTGGPRSRPTGGVSNTPPPTAPPADGSSPTSRGR